MVGLFFLCPHIWATISGLFSLNSPSSPTHWITSLHSLSVSNSSKNCHSWICPLLPVVQIKSHHMTVTLSCICSIKSEMLRLNYSSRFANVYCIFSGIMSTFWVNYYLYQYQFIFLVSILKYTVTAICFA